MAFEDRCSPHQANSPGPVTSRVPPTNFDNIPASVHGYNANSTQYTCTTIDNRYSRDLTQSSNQSLLAVVKMQPVSPPSSPDQRTVNGSDCRMNYESYYKQFPNNDLSGGDRGMMHLSNAGTLDIKPNIDHLEQNAFCRNHFNVRNEDERRRTIEDVDVTINFSISNILHPEFGLNAIRKTNKREGPKVVGPNHSILYKPYDLSKQNGVKLNRNDFNKTHNNSGYEYLRSANARAEDHFRMAPLGSLRHAVSQIGVQSREMDLSAKSFEACGQSKVEIQNKRPDSASSVVSSASSGAPSAVSSGNGDSGSQNGSSGNSSLWPAWVYCTRYSDRPSSGPRSRRAKKTKPVVPAEVDKRPRTAFSGSQLSRLKHEFAENKYLTERRRQHLASELGLAEAQIKIWFQNKRAKIKKASGQRNPLALQLMAQGLYNHTTADESDEGDEEISVT